VSSREFLTLKGFLFLMETQTVFLFLMEILKELQTLKEFLILRRSLILKEFLKVLTFQTWKVCLTKKIQMMLSLY
jgi:hypothetical protein